MYDVFWVAHDAIPQLSFDESREVSEIAIISWFPFTAFESDGRCLLLFLFSIIASAPLGGCSIRWLT